MKFLAGYRAFGRPPKTQQLQYIDYQLESKSVFLRIAFQENLYEDRKDCFIKAKQKSIVWSKE